MAATSSTKALLQLDAAERALASSLNGSPRNPGGETLQHRILKGRLPPLIASKIAVQIARGLAGAHRAGIAHRDLKPSNVILTAQGAPRIIGFEIAGLGGKSELTRYRQTAGTVAYMSPEQALGQPADHRSDLWSLGVLLYEMLTGRLPFPGENDETLRYAIVNRPAPQMPGVAPVLQAVLQRALAKRPEDRYQSAEELILDLEFVDTREERPTVLQSVSHADRREPRRWALLWVSLLASLLVAVSIVAARHTGLWGGLSPPAKYVAVLPFQTPATDPAEQALAIGFARVITDSLEQLEASNSDFLIVSAGEVQAQRITQVSAARNAFSVTKAFTTEMTHQNGRVRLSLTLVDAVRQQPELSALIEESEENLPAMRDRVISEAVRMLGLKVKAQASPGASPQAYASWLRGIGFLERYDKTGNIEAAIGEFEAALRVSTDPLVLAWLSQAYFALYETSKDSLWLVHARLNASKAIALDRKLTAAYISRGAARHSDGDYKGAVKDFAQASQLNSRTDEVYNGLGRAFECMGLKERAESAYRKAISARPGYWPGHNRLGTFYQRQGRLREAAEQFRIMVHQTPGNASGYSSLGMIYLMLGEWSEAERMLQTAVRIAPRTPAYHNSLGNLLMRRRSYEEAARTYEKAIDLDSRNYRIWANLGASCSRIPGRQDRARYAYRRAAELAEEARAANPIDASVLSNLAGYYAFLGKDSLSLELLGIALSLAPGDRRVLVNAAETYDVLGLREQALVWLVKAIRAGFPLDEVEQSAAFEDLLKDSRFRKLLNRSTLNPDSAASICGTTT